MSVWFWIFLDQICPKWIKMDQTWSNWRSHQSKNVAIKSCRIYHEDTNGQKILIRLDQICPKWIKIGFLPSHINHRFLTIIYSSLFIIFLINSLQWVFFNLFENKQYFNLFLARDQRKLLTCFSRNPYPKFPTFSMFYQFWIFFINILDHFSNNCHFFGSYWIRSVQNGSKRIKLDQMEVLTNQKLLL